MDVIGPIFLMTIILIVMFVVYRKIMANRRSTFITDYQFPRSIETKVNALYPHLSQGKVDQVMRGLRDYFHLILLSDQKTVAMPSQVVDVAWHEFILFTREYATFCANGLGRFLHHMPAEAMKERNQAQSSIKRAWRISCHREGINPYQPHRLPKIFALDALLAISDGFHYELNCMSLPGSTSGGQENGGTYCGSHVGCSSGCAGSAGDGGCSGDSGGGGCGGD